MYSVALFCHLWYVDVYVYCIISFSMRVFMCAYTVYVINVMAYNGSGCIHIVSFSLSKLASFIRVRMVLYIFPVFVHVFLFVFPVDPGNPTMAVSIVHLFAWIPESSSRTKKKRDIYTPLYLIEIEIYIVC